MIAITFALPAESSGVRQLLKRKDVPAGRTRAVVFHTGVGGRICRERMKDFLERQPVDVLISSGFAGALSDELRVGDLLVAENFSDLSLTNKVRLLLKNHTPLFGRLETAPAIIEDATARRRLRDASGAIAVDMETASIAEACARRGIRMLGLRVISDSFTEPFPAPPDVLFNIDRQKTDAVALTRHVLAHPSTLVGLVRFSRRIARARAKLSSAIEDLLRSDFI